MQTQLRERANELAKEFKSETSNDQLVDIVKFTLDKEHYGILSSYVSRICESKNITTLPSTPGFIEGIINVHGNIVCVINLKHFFELPKITESKQNRILIINHNDFKIGILADSVLGVEQIALNQIQASLPTLTGVRSDLLTGITNDQIIILNVDNLLAAKELIINDVV